MTGRRFFVLLMAILSALTPPQIAQVDKVSFRLYDSTNNSVKENMNPKGGFGFSARLWNVHPDLNQWQRFDCSKRLNWNFLLWLDKFVLWLRHWIYATKNWASNRLYSYKTGRPFITGSILGTDCLKQAIRFCSPNNCSSTIQWMF